MNEHVNNKLNNKLINIKMKKKETHRVKFLHFTFKKLNEMNKIYTKIVKL